MNGPFDAVLVVSFGGPEGRDEVMPFLENVLRGRNVPRERMLEVAQHYELFNSVSPINAQNRALIAALQEMLKTGGPDLPIYWGNRNWHPLLADTLRQMTADGVHHALAFFTSAYSSYSSCRQYREDIAKAQAEVGPDAPQVSLLRKFYNHPGFIQPNIDRVRAALEEIPRERRAAAHIAFTAHSIPESMAQNCMYEAQLTEAGQLIAEGVGNANWRLVYQSRSGAPNQPWLGPDIKDHLRDLKAQSITDVVVAPIGFISDHLEVRYDLDIEASQLADGLGVNLIRAATVSLHPMFIAMLRDLIVEQITTGSAKPTLGTHGPTYCAVECCLPGSMRPAVSTTEVKVDRANTR